MAKFASQIKDLHASLKQAEKAIEERDSTIRNKNTEIDLLEKEKDEKAQQLDKYKSGASVEMKDLQTKMTMLEAERKRLLFQINDLERNKEEAHIALENQKGELGDLENNLKNKITDLEQENELIKKSFEAELIEERKKQEELRKTIADMKTEKDKILREKQKSEDQIIKLKKVINDFLSFKDTVILTVKKLLKGYEQIESNLSCLSCLEFLEDPLMLICGHSICLKWFKTHSDPNSKESIVFWEECKIETKNKELMESKVIVILCEKFKFAKKAATEVLRFANEMRADEV